MPGERVAVLPGNGLKIRGRLADYEWKAYPRWIKQYIAKSDSRKQKMVEQTDSLAGNFSAKETTDTQYGMGILEGKPYQGLDASSWAIFVHNPDLRMQRKSIQEPVNVLGLSSTQLLKDFDLVKGSVDGNIFRMGIVVFGIGIENLQGDQLTAAEIRAAWRELSASTSKEKQAYSTGANSGQLERVWGEVRSSTARIVNKRKTGE